MKSVSSYIFRAICTLMIGLLLIINPDTPLFLIEVIAALFAVSGLYSVIANVIQRFSKHSVVRPAFPLAGLGSLLFGLVIGLHPDAFLHILMYLLGGLILLLSIGQLMAIISYRGLVPLKWTVFVIPVLMVLVGLFVMVHYREAASLPFTILGVCCMFNGLSDLFYGLRLRHYERVNTQFSEYEEVHETSEPSPSIEDIKE